MSATRKISSVSTDTSQTSPRRRRRRAMRCLALGSVFAASVGIGANSASANEPSDWSYTVPGSHIEIGWTRDHAWVISSWTDAIAWGASELAGEICSAISGEPGPFNPTGIACSNAVQPIVQELLADSERLSDHGLWLEYYLWPAETRAGTW